LIAVSDAKCAPIATRFAQTHETFARTGATCGVTWSIGEPIYASIERIDVRTRQDKSYVRIGERSERTPGIFAPTAGIFAAISEIDAATFAIIDATKETHGEIK
jgi:hypothetical protein